MNKLKNIYLRVILCNVNIIDFFIQTQILKMSFLDNFTQTVNFDDFSNSQILDDFCKKNFGLTCQEIEKLQISEKEQLLLNDLVSKNVMKTIFEPKLPQLINERINQSNNFSINQLNKYVRQNDKNKLMEVYKNTTLINSSKILSSYQLLNTEIKRLAFDSCNYYCHICKTEHKLTEKSFEEKILCEHQEKIMEEIFRLFVDQDLKIVADLTLINLKHMNREFLKLRDLTRGIGITSYTAIIQNANFVAEMAIFLLHQLKTLTKDDNRRILLAKYIYEIIKYINTDSFQIYIIRSFGKFRKTNENYLWTLFEYIQSDISEDVILNNCMLNGKLNKNDIIKINNQIAKYRNKMREFEKCVYNNLFAQMNEIIVKGCSKRFEFLFDYLFKEFTDDSKTYFVKVFNEDVWKKYSKSIELSIIEEKLFERGKSFEIIVDKILEITKDIIQNNVNLIPNDYYAPTPMNVFAFNGLKYIATYKYTKDEDPLLHAYLETLHNFKRELFEIQICDEHKSLIPMIYNENLSLISSLKTDEDWLKYFKPKCFDDMRYGIYFYFRNNKDLAFSLIKYEKFPNLKLIPKNKLKIIKKIFNINDERLNEYILSLSAL